jgi:hypothetical protein
LICEWEDGAVEVRYRNERIEYEDLVLRPSVDRAPKARARHAPARGVGGKPAQDHPWRQGYEQRMKLQKLNGSQGVNTRWGVRLRYALNAPHKPRRRASLRRTPQRQQQIKRKGTFLKRLDITINLYWQSLPSVLACAEDSLDRKGLRHANPECQFDR